MKILQDFSLTELKRELETIIEKMPRYRAEQVYKWANDYVSFDEMTNIPQDLREKLKENFEALLGAIIKAKPSGAKGTYMKRISISSTMGAGVRVDLANL